MMTTDQQRKILEAAAKACELDLLPHDALNELWVAESDALARPWNPIANSADTASMCAKLDINTYWWPEYVDCTTQNISCDIPHDGTDEGKEAAWRLAATMVAAKIGGYSE